LIFFALADIQVEQCDNTEECLESFLFELITCHFEVL